MKRAAWSAPGVIKVANKLEVDMSHRSTNQAANKNGCGSTMLLSTL